MKQAEEVIKYAKMLNTENLSALRSGNISVRYNDGFLITPSGVKYSSLKIDDIVFVSLNGQFDEKKQKPSSEWKFHRDIYKNNVIPIEGFIQMLESIKSQKILVGLASNAIRENVKMILNELKIY